MVNPIDRLKFLKLDLDQIVEPFRETLKECLGEREKFESYLKEKGLDNLIRLMDEPSLD